MNKEIALFEVIYQVKLSEKNKEKVIPPKIFEMIQEVDSLLHESSTFQLLFSSTKSQFTSQRSFDDNSNFANKIAEALIENNRSHFVDIATNTSLIEIKNFIDTEKGGFGEILLLIDDSQLIWEITDATAEINGFPCRYATGIIKSATADFSDTAINAWFTDVYPYPFGPQKLNGLPGLIIQGQVEKKTYSVSSIRKMHKQEETITIPKWNKETTLSSHYHQQLKAFKEKITSKE